MLHADDRSAHECQFAAKGIPNTTRAVANAKAIIATGSGIETETYLDDPDGNKYDGRTVAEMDARRLFEYLPLLGQKFNETLVVNDSIPAHGAADKMIAARFDAPESRLEKRRRFILRIEDVDGPITEIPEK